MKMKRYSMIALAIASWATIACDGGPTAPNARSAPADADLGRTAADPVQITRTNTPFNLTVDDQCTGEQVTLMGMGHTVQYTRVTNGVAEFWGYQYTTDLRGVGVKSGAAYRGFDLDVFGADFTFATATVNGELVRRYVISKGKQDNLYVEIHFKAMYDPAANAITFARVSTKTTCFNAGRRERDDD